MSRNDVKANEPSYCEGQYDFVGLLRRLHLAKRNSTDAQPSFPRESLMVLDRSQENFTLRLPPVEVDTSHTTSSLATTPRKKPIYEAHAADWTNYISRNDEKWIGGGGFGDVYEGEWKEEHLPESEPIETLPRIVVKKFRVSQNGTGSEMKTVLREIAVWSRLQHENVVRFVGVLHARGMYPCLVSEYMRNGSVKTYLSKASGVCLRSLIRGISLGLQYLHHYSPSIVHGDLKPDNILINKKGMPCLCDFGLSRMLIENTLWHSSATKAGGTMRWQAPELLRQEECRVTTASDMYAYAMCCYEIVTGLPPFHQHKNEPQLMLAILNKSKISRPIDRPVANDIWGLWSRCWSYEAEDRPSISGAVAALGPPCCGDESSSRCSFNSHHSLEELEEYSTSPSSKMNQEWPEWQEVPPEFPEFDPTPNAGLVEATTPTSELPDMRISSFQDTDILSHETDLSTKGTAGWNTQERDMVDFNYNDDLRQTSRRIVLPSANDFVPDRDQLAPLDSNAQVFLAANVQDDNNEVMTQSDDISHIRRRPRPYPPTRPHHPPSFTLTPSKSSKIPPLQTLHLERLRQLELLEDSNILSLEPWRALCRKCGEWVPLDNPIGEGGGVKFSVLRWMRHWRACDSAAE